MRWSARPARCWDRSCSARSRARCTATSARRSSRSVASSWWVSRCSRGSVPAAPRDRQEEFAAMNDFRSELKLPAHAGSAVVARAWSREIARLADVVDLDADRFAEAVATACADVVEGEPASDEPDAIVLTAVVSVSALSVSLRERGAPFDPAAAAASPVRGRDWEWIRRAVDEARWAGRGSAGMELTLIKQRALRDVTDHVTPTELSPFRHDEPLAPPQSYEVRRPRPADAVGVAQCVYRSYGYTYSNPDLYYPERIVHLNETGHLVSLVAADASGAIVGHLALERPDLGPVAESGQAVVSPAHRGR